MAFDNDESAKAVIRDGVIYIGLPVANIGAALEGAWASGCRDHRFKITDPDAFAKELVRELNREDEIGTTLIHNMFDEAMYEAIDQGAPGVEEHENQDGDEMLGAASITPPQS
jgi:hypothetical protein